MDIHKPKPFHSFREFLSEITVIVVGIAIALTLEQVVEVIREHRNSAEAREAIANEIGRSLFRLQARVASETCVADRLKVLGEVLVRAHEGAMIPQPSWVSRPQYWSFPTGAWVAATTAGRAALLNKSEVELYGYVYQRLTALEREEEREQVAWAHLRGLETWKGPLGQSGRAEFVLALQEARYSHYRVNSIATDILASAQKSGIEVVEIPGMRHSNGICLPITETREHAVSVSGGPTGDPD